MKIFPIGTAVAATNLATIDSKKYAFFEPNKSVSSNKMHTTLVTRFENQSMLTRKKAEPFLMITYEYEDIFDREYRQVEHFLDDVDDALTSFRVVDLSKGKKPSAITDSSGDWVVSISNTRMYSATANLRADSAFVWNGRAWKEGSVSAITANTSEEDMENCFSSGMNDVIPKPISVKALKEIIDRFQDAQHQVQK